VIRRTTCITFAGAILIARAATAQSPTIVRGRITDSLKLPIADVELTITGDAETRKPKTDATGRFTAVFPDGPRSVFLVARKIGYQPRGWAVGLTGQMNVITADAVLNRTIVELPLLTSLSNGFANVARLPVVIGGSETVVNPGRLNLRDPSDLNELLSAITGIFSTDSGSSVLGAPVGQETILVDGMKLDGRSLPPDAMTSIRISTTTSDASHGQNASATLNIATRRGTDVVQSTIRGAFTDPFLAWKDASSPRLPYRSEIISGYVAGPIQRGSAHFSLSWTATEHVTDASSALAPLASRLAQVGMSPDTIAAATCVLSTLGVPLTAGDVPDNAVTRSGSAWLTIDAQPTAGTSLLITINPSWRSSGGPTGTLAFPSRATESTGHAHLFGAQLTGLVAGHLDVLHTQVTLNGSDVSGYSDLPSGTVRVGTTLGDGQTGLTALSFGGSGVHSSQENTHWESRNDYTVISSNGLHKLDIGQSLDVQWHNNLIGFNTNGSYSYASLDALAADAPDLYSRALDVTSTAYRSTLAGLWIGDIWRAGYSVGVQGGIRADYATVSPSPTYNPAVFTQFGRRTDQVPSDFGISPHVGFTWVIDDRRGKDLEALGLSRAEGTNIVRRVVGIGPGEAFPVVNNNGRGYRLFGTIGAYRGTMNTDAIGSLNNATGLPGTQQNLTCIGDAVPLPDWSGVVAAPATCRDGSGATTFASTTPNVRLFDPGYRAFTTWKGSLGFGGLYAGTWSIRPELDGALNYNMASQVDLNLRDVPVFALANEANRPVFVAPAQIDPRSGLIAPGASRINPAFGVVSNTLSDLHGRAARFYVSASTEKAIGTFPLQIEYSLDLQRTQVRGTGLDPLAVEWVAGNAPVHQIAISSNGYRIWWFTLGARLNLYSGQAYTPTVVGDVNGDGRGGDPAFVFDPMATGVDPALAAQMKQLLDSAPGAARSCLQQQMGKVAGNNSCRTSWQSRFDINLDFAPPLSVGISNRLRFSTRLLNAGGAIVRLLGLENTPLGQAAGTTQPDTRLLYVTGFDSVTQQFKYQVNQLFGRPLDFGTTRRQAPPFQLQLGVEYQFGRAPSRNNVGAMNLFEKNGMPKSDEEIGATLREQYTRNPAEPILALRDSLGLTPEQIQKLEALRDEFRAAADSSLGPAVQYVKKEGRQMTDAQLLQEIGSLRARMPSILAYRARIEAVLTAEQKWKLTAPTAHPRPILS
jgi:hypothetical protein